MSSNNLSSKDGENCPADFEKAIEAASFGKFNVILFIITIPAAWACAFPKSATSYVPQFATCDLDLALSDKGLLNAIVFAGMVSSAFIWGFFSDAFGRKKIMLGGFFLNAIFIVVSGLSQNFSLLLFAKFMDGFTICGPYAIYITYISELSSLKHRGRAVLFFGTIATTAYVMVAALGLAILTQPIEVILFNGGIVLHSWNVFLLVTSFASFICTIGLYFLPESPKYLMAMGENEKALETFKKIYSINTGKSPDTYPIKQLTSTHFRETRDEEKNVVIIKRKKMEIFIEALNQLKSLFIRPHVFVMVHIGAMEFFMYSGANMLAIWLPQIFSTINDYTTGHGGQDADLCTMIEIVDAPQNGSTTCNLNMENTAIFYNAMYPAAFAILAYLVTTISIKYIGKNVIYFLSGLVSGVLAFCLYFSPNTVSVVVFMTAGWSLGSVASMVMISIVVDLFPTSLRAMAVSLTLVIGRFGTMLGSIVFPYLLESGCLTPFLTISVMILLATFLIIPLPNPDKNSLE